MHHGRGNWCPALAMAALFAVATITGCAFEDATPNTPAAVEESPQDTVTDGYALGVGCMANSQCTIAALTAEGYEIAECMTANGFCSRPSGAPSECVGAVSLTCAENLSGDGNEVSCDDGLDNDGDGDTDGDDPDCEGATCSLDEPATCMSSGAWQNGVCVPQDDENGTWCGYESECHTNSYCHDGDCVEDSSTSTCCFFNDDCPSCPNGYVRSCSEPQLESDFGQCSCVSVNAEICFDGIDNNGDGVRDCDDPACEDLVYCNSDQPCCSPHEEPGCEDTQIVMDVCLDLGDTYCCQWSWDWICVAEYNMLYKEAHDTALDICAGPEVCDVWGDEDFDGAFNCEDSDCATHPACTTPEEDCANEGDEDDNGLSDCADPACSEFPACVPETTEVSIRLNSPWYYQGCAGPTSGLYPSCSWDLDAGQVVTWDPAEGERFLFTFTNGSSWPLSVNCATGAISLTGGVTLASVFDDPNDLVDLGCTGVCKDGGRQVLCTGVPAE